MKGGYTNVQCDMQWVRRCKQEEITLIDAFDEEDDDQMRTRLLK